jgi:hypothetical protein
MEAGLERRHRAGGLWPWLGFIDEQGQRLHGEDAATDG